MMSVAKTNGEACFDRSSERQLESGVYGAVSAVGRRTCKAPTAALEEAPKKNIDWGGKGRVLKVEAKSERPLRDF